MFHHIALFVSTSTKGIEMIIHAGYRIEVTTWENDADNYKTCVLDGIESKDGVHAIVKYLNLHKSRSRGSQYFGNMYDPSAEDIEVYDAKLFELYQEDKEFWDAYFDVDGEDIPAPAADTVGDYFYDCIGIYVGINGSEEFFTRVVEEIEISYVPSKIMLEDVTTDFV